MPEPSKGQSNQILFTVMILLLIVIAGMQTWYIVGIKKQLNTIQSVQTSAQSSVAKNTTQKEKTAVTDKTLSSAELETAVEQEKQAVQQNAQQVPAIDQSLPSEGSPSIPAPPYSPPYFKPDWDPYEEIERMQRHMESVFNNPYHPYKRPDFRRHFRQDISTPRMDVREDDKQYTIFVNVPGTDAKSLSVNLDGQRLTVRGIQDYEKKDRDRSGRIIFSERRSGRFQRSITLPEPVERKGMKTQIDKGVLRIIIPKMR